MFQFVNLNVTLFHVFTFNSICATVRIWYGNSVHLSVRPSVTRVDFIKTAEQVNISSKFFHSLISP